MREGKNPVTRRIIRNKAVEMFSGTDIKVYLNLIMFIPNNQVSDGWLQKFLKRHKFVLRRRTTACQKAPVNYAEDIAKFILFIENRRNVVKFSSIMAMDETAVWFDSPNNTCIEKKGAKEVFCLFNFNF